MPTSSPASFSQVVTCWMAWHRSGCCRTSGHCFSDLTSIPGRRPGRHSLMASSSSFSFASRDEEEDEEDDLDDEEEDEEDDPAETLGVHALRGNVPGRMSGWNPPELDDDEEDEDEACRG